MTESLDAFILKNEKRFKSNTRFALLLGDDARVGNLRSASPLMALCAKVDLDINDRIKRAYIAETSSDYTRQCLQQLITLNSFLIKFQDMDVSGRVNWEHMAWYRITSATFTYDYEADKPALWVVDFELDVSQP